MNDDFEQRLQTLRRVPLPAEWKAEILSRAVAPPSVLRPPRWLAMTWGAAWAVVVVLNLTSVPSLSSVQPSVGAATPFNTQVQPSSVLFVLNKDSHFILP